MGSTPTQTIGKVMNDITHCVTKRHLGHGVDPVVYYVGSETDCTNYMTRITNKVAADHHEAAQEYNSKWVASLAQAELCTYASEDYVVFHNGFSHFYDEYQDVLDDIRYHTTGDGYKDYINQRLPKLIVVPITPYEV